MKAAARQSRMAIGSRSQGGAALVTGLILLMILTLLAISGMNTSTLELQMAGNFQFSQNAFQAAEIGIQRALASGQYATNAWTTVPPTLITGSATDTPDTYATVTRFDCAKNGETMPPPRPGASFSIGEGMGFAAYHFEVESTGRSSRSARAVNVQNFYVVRQEGGCPF